MTFYNIIFGLVFVMSFFTSISVLGAAKDRLLLFSESVLILLMSFNDIINTSDAVEHEKTDYPLSLKSLDALNFVFYMISIFAIQPDNDISNINVTNLIPKHDETVFWAIVMMIFLVGLLWNIIKDKKLTIRYNRFILSFSLFSFVMVLLSILYNDALTVMTPIFLVVYLAFLLTKIIKPTFQTGS